jgi:hypothetical protein
VKINQLFQFLKPLQSYPAPAPTGSNPVVQHDQVTLGNSPAPLPTPADKQLAENPPAEKDALKDLPFQSVDNLPPKSSSTHHAKALFVEDHDSLQFPYPGESKSSTPTIPSGIWMEDPGTLNHSQAQSGTCFQDALAQITKDLESVKDTKAHMKTAMAAMAGLSGVGMMGAGMMGMAGAMMGLGMGMSPLAQVPLPSLGSGVAPPQATPLATPQAPPQATPLAMPTAPVPAAQTVQGPEAVQDLKTLPPAERARATREAVKANLKAMGTSATFKVDQHLFPLLDKVGLDSVEFFTARACWQGVHSKRREVLEKVLDQFPKLPKDQKNVDAAIAAVRANGTPCAETDCYFLHYFIENRKEMKTLFRATLNLFEGDKVTVYRGQSDSKQYAANATKPLGCYSFDPNVSESWGDNLKRYRVKLSDVWSTSVVTQNNHHTERELTVYSRGGVRKGERITNNAEVMNEFNKNYSPGDFMNYAEGEYVAPKATASSGVATASNPIHVTPAYGSD